MNVRAENPTTLPVARDSRLVEDRAAELRVCNFAALTRWLYPRLRGPGMSVVRRLLIRVLCAREGGAMRSATVRRLMEEVHGVTIGAHSYGCLDPVRFPPGTRIGRYVSIGPGVWAFRRNHPSDRLSMHPYFYHPSFGAEPNADVPTEPLTIEAGSWLGAGVVILPGCRRIGRGAVVAAGAVLTRDVPDYAIIGGNPARLIRYRFSEASIAAAEATAWWRKSPSNVRRSHDMGQPWFGQAFVNEDAGT